MTSLTRSSMNTRVWPRAPIRAAVVVGGGSALLALMDELLAGHVRTFVHTPWSGLASRSVLGHQNTRE